MKKAGLLLLVIAILFVVSLLLYLSPMDKPYYRYGYAYLFTIAVVLASLLGWTISLGTAIVASLVFSWAVGMSGGSLWVGIMGAVSWLLTACLASVIVAGFSKRIRFLSMLSDMDKRMCSMLDMSNLLSTLVQETVKALGVKGCSIRLLDLSGQKLEVKAVYGLSKEYLDKGPVDVEHSRVDKEVLEGKVVYIEDATKDPRFQYPEEAKREGIVSVLSVPLKVADRKIGVVRIYTSKPHRFSQEEIDFVNSVAAQAAIALQNAALYENLRKQYRDLEDILWKSIW